MTTTPDPDRARELIQQPGIVWHQRFALAPGVDAPGVNDIGWIAQKVGFPDDLTGQSALDIGTTNGGAAFMAEARGANSVVATDIVSQSRFRLRSDCRTARFSCPLRRELGVRAAGEARGARH